VPKLMDQPKIVKVLKSLTDKSGVGKRDSRGQAEQPPFEP